MLIFFRWFDRFEDDSDFKIIFEYFFNKINFFFNKIKKCDCKLLSGIIYNIVLKIKWTILFLIHMLTKMQLKLISIWLMTFQWISNSGNLSLIIKFSKLSFKNILRFVNHHDLKNLMV